MKEYPDISTIIQFLEGTLPEAEMADLEVRALQDEAFRKELEISRTLIRGIKESGSESTQEEKIQRLKEHPVDELDDSEETEEKKGGIVVRIRRYRKRVLYPIAMVASLALLIIIPQREYIWGPRSPEQLFKKYYEVPENTNLTDTRSGEDRPPTWEAYQAYDRGDYAEAARLFDASIPQNDWRLTDLFYLGNCYLVLKDWGEAIKVLKEVAIADKSMSNEARWYLALAYMRNGHIDKAKPLFEQIQQPKKRVKQAQRILSKLQ